MAKIGRLFIIDEGSIHAIYNAGFNHGSNEGPFPEHGTFDEVKKLMNGDLLLDGSYKQGIRIMEIEATEEQYLDHIQNYNTLDKPKAQE